MGATSYRSREVSARSIEPALSLPKGPRALGRELARTEVRAPGALRLYSHASHVRSTRKIIRRRGRVYLESASQVSPLAVDEPDSACDHM